MLIIFIISFILIICIICVTNRKRLLEKNYYEIDETFPVLNNIHNNLDIFQSEVNNIVDDTLWLDWVEKNLYNKEDSTTYVGGISPSMSPTASML